MDHWEGAFCGAGELALFCQRWRPEGAPRAVLAIVHGLGEHSSRYPNVVEYMVPRGYAVYGFDLRGHGRSPGKRGYIASWDEFREDVRRFLQWIGEEEAGCPLFLMGHSLGGLIALEFVLRHPEGLAGVIASAPSLSAEGISRVAMILGPIISRVWPAFQMETGLDSTTISRDPAVVRAYQEDPLVHSKGTARMAAEGNVVMDWTLSHAADLHLPLLVIHGGADRLVPPGISLLFFDQVLFADKERREYEGRFHELHNDFDHQQVLADVEDWMARHLPT